MVHELTYKAAIFGYQLQTIAQLADNLLYDEQVIHVH